jgi:hypothetical protein
MPFRIEPPFDMIAEREATFQQVAALVEDASETVYVIDDFSDVPLRFDDIVLKLAHLTRNKPGSPSDPRIQYLLVGTHEMLELAARSASQRQYGEVEMPLFESIDDALEYARRERVR